MEALARVDEAPTLVFTHVAPESTPNNNKTLVSIYVYLSLAELLAGLVCCPVPCLPAENNTKKESHHSPFLAHDDSVLCAVAAGMDAVH